MSGRVAFEDAETVLSPVGVQVPPGEEALSVDLPQAISIRKGQCCEQDSFAALFAHKKCGHAATYADTDDECYECIITAEPVELSRRRLDRRRRAAQRILVNKHPLTTDERLSYVRSKRDAWAAITVDDLDDAERLGEEHRDKSLLKAWRRGKWFPVAACCIVPRFDGMSLEQRVSGKVDRNGVFRCGSAWTCPSCCQRISVPRQQQIRDVQDAARSDGFVTAMFTFTMPHDKATSLDTGMNRMKDALRRFHSDGTGRARKAELGYVGHVTSTEVTLALDEELHDNGWHAHAHGMFVFEIEGEMTLAQDKVWALDVKIALFDVWRRSALAAGSSREPSFVRGFDVRVAWSSTDYIVKLPEQAKKKEEAGKKRWGIEAELTKSYMKEGRKKSRTPFELLDSDRPRDHELFLEYAVATYGRSQIEWSRGKNDLRKRFLGEGYADLSDEDAAIAEPDWDFADDHVKPDCDPVVERADIAAGDCWRAIKYGRNALDLAIASVDGGGALNLEIAMREEGFVLERVTPSWSEEVDVFYTDDMPDKGITSGDPVVEIVRNHVSDNDWKQNFVVRDQELSDFLAFGPLGGWNYRMRQAKRVVFHPKHYWAFYPPKPRTTSPVVNDRNIDATFEHDLPY